MIVVTCSYHREVERTQGISTTNLVGRMLLMTKDHFQKGDVEYSVEKDGELTQTLNFSRFCFSQSTTLISFYM